MITQRINRRRAVVMFADMMGYSKIMDEDENLAIAMRQKMEQVLKTSISDFDGTIIQFFGDGVLCTFSEADKALFCAKRLQQMLRQDPIIPVRIGLHAGEIAFDEQNIYGDTVNIASRIESFGIPGSVLFSEEVQRKINNANDLPSEELGVFELKNIRKPIRLFALRAPHLILPNRESLKGKGQMLKNSLAVLPFVNMSSDPENEYFSDGISEEILNVVSKVKELQVTARTSSFSYKGKNLDVRHIGKELGVETVLEGSVRKAGSMVRITAQLIDTKDGYHLFSETYDRKLDDIFAIQDEIALKVSDLLKSRLGVVSNEKSLLSAPTQNMEAYNAFLKGLFHWNQYTPTEAGKAVGYFDKAIELDPNFPQPYAIKSFCLAFLGGTTEMNHKEALPAARESALKAIELDANLVEAHCALGLVRLFHDWDFKAADNYFQKAASLNNSDSNYLTTYSLFLLSAGRYQKAIKKLEQSLEVDPLSFLSRAYLADALNFSGDYSGALKIIDEIDDSFPEHPYATLLRSWNYIFSDELEKASQTLKRKISMKDPVFKDFVVLRGIVAALLKDWDRFHRCKNRIIELVPDYPHTGLNLQLAMLSIGENKIDDAFDFLEKAIEKRIPGMVFVVNHPLWSKINHDPRAVNILKHLQLPSKTPF